MESLSLIVRPVLVSVVLALNTIHKEEPVC